MTDTPALASVGFVVFSVTTGEILRVGSCPPSMVEQQANSADQATVEYDAPNGFDATHYITGIGTDSLEVVAKTAIPVVVSAPSVKADEIDEIVFSGIPLDAAVQIVHPDAFAEYIEHDGSVEFSTEVIGTHRIRFMGVPYLFLELSFEATP